MKGIGVAWISDGYESNTQILNSMCMGQQDKHS
jgi:hypothetical protein